MLNAPVLGVSASLTGRRWAWHPGSGAGDDRRGLAIAQRHDIPEILGRLLALRGISVEAAVDFLAPTLRALLPDPAVMIDMEAAAARLARAVRTGETIGVFGDYDVDGACSTAILTLMLRELGCTVLPYIPDRMTEGYGPNEAALRRLAARGASLLVCVDCGTAAGAILAELHGHADIVVLDHHKSEGPPPAVVATVNPNRLDCTSRLGHLCAAAIAFLTAVATVRLLRQAGHFSDSRPTPDLLGLLDLVALATVCDVMPLAGVNRALVTQGLKVMGRRQRVGIAALLDVAEARDHPTAHTLGFVLGPRINAAGRISEADLGLRLLLCEDPVEARALAATLDAVNRQRQDVEASMLDTAMAMAAAQVEAGHPALLVAHADWHPGVVGIVAGRLREKFNRPACVAGIAHGHAKGSGRSVPGLDLGAVVLAARAAGILATGGGHAMAAGFGLGADRLGAFHAFLDAHLAEAAHLPAAADLHVEGTLSVAACTPDLAGHLGRLAPFGNGNDEPLVALPRARIVRAERVGREAATVRAFVEGEEGGRLKAMLFRGKEGTLAQRMLEWGGAPLHLAGHLRAELWNGGVSTTFVVSDAAETVAS